MESRPRIGHLDTQFRRSIVMPTGYLSRHLEEPRGRLTLRQPNENLLAN